MSEESSDEDESTKHLSAGHKDDDDADDDDSDAEYVDDDDDDDEWEDIDEECDSEPVADDAGRNCPDILTGPQLIQLLRSLCHIANSQADVHTVGLVCRYLMCTKLSTV